MLFFVGTPIGNLGDVTYRAIETLKSADVIACEDTRHSLALLNRYEIKKPLVAYHKFNERAASVKIIEQLKQGKNIAVITDAGMPVVSDPGNVLVNELIKEGLNYTVIPGPSAFTSALVLAGLPSDRFVFIGFLPEKTRDRRELLEKFAKVEATLIFYSAPHDVIGDVKSLYEVLGDRKAAAVKEITKIHESVYRFTLKEGIVGEPKGEYVLLVEGACPEAENADLTDEQLIDKYIAEGMPKKDALKRVAKERNVAKSELYKYTIDK